MRKSFIPSALVATVAALAVHPAVASPVARTGHALGPARATVPNRLFVSDLYGSAVLVYSNGAHPKLLRAITTGISQPEKMNVDRFGSLYVANFGSASVTVYPLGATAPSLTIGGGLEHPSSVAIAADGTVYVADYAGEVQEYHAGATQPFLTIPAVQGSSESVEPFDVAVDGAGYAYVYYDVQDSSHGGFAFVKKFAPGQRRGRRLPFETYIAGGIDVDSHRNVAVNTYGYSSSSYVAVYGPGGALLHQWPDGEAAAMLRIGSNERRVYTTSFAGTSISVYSYPDGLVLQTIPTASSTPGMGIAISPAHG